jgi:hypothetical protein
MLSYIHGIASNLRSHFEEFTLMHGSDLTVGTVPCRKNASSSAPTSITLVESLNNDPKEIPTVARVGTVLLSVCVTACAAERNWSRWGLTFQPNRNRLGLA